MSIKVYMKKSRRIWWIYRYFRKILKQSLSVKIYMKFQIYYKMSFIKMILLNIRFIWTAIQWYMYMFEIRTFSHFSKIYCLIGSSIVSWSCSSPLDERLHDFCRKFIAKKLCKLEDNFIFILLRALSFTFTYHFLRKTTISLCFGSLNFSLISYRTQLIVIFMYPTYFKWSNFGMS